MDSQTHEDGYAGEATLSVKARDITAQVILRGYFEPIDGRYHWYGRIAADDELTELVGTGKTPASIATPHGAAAGQLTDLDTWGRYRISGVGTPPFPIARTVDDVEPGRAEPTMLKS